MERRRDSAAGIGRAAGAEDSALCALRADFPQFRIWPETTGARTLYVARRLCRDTHPHTLVTADLNELRAALSEDPGLLEKASSAQSRGTAAPSPAFRPVAHPLAGSRDRHRDVSVAAHHQVADDRTPSDRK